MTNNFDKALIFFAQSPVCGKVKSKLTPQLTPEQACALHEALMLDVIDVYHSVHDVDLLLFYESSDDRKYFQIQIPDIPQFLQDGATHGERMRNAFDEAFSQGHRRVLLFHTELPTLPLRNIFSAFHLLDAFDDAIVVGPLDDGGIYSIGLKMPLPEIFEGIKYDRSNIYYQMMKRICRLDLAVYVLPPWYNITTIADVKRLDVDLSNPEFSGSILHRTKQYMQYLHDNNVIPNRHLGILRSPPSADNGHPPKGVLRTIRKRKKVK